MNKPLISTLFILVIGISACSEPSNNKGIKKEVADGSHLSGNERVSDSEEDSQEKFIDVEGPIGTSTEGTPPGTLTPKQPIGTMKSIDHDCEDDPACDPVEAMH